MEEQYIQSAISCILPVLEKATLLGTEYTKKCGRSILTARDLEYAMKYCARHKVGESLGPDHPDVWAEAEEDDQDQDDSVETVNEDEEPFTRYSGEDSLMLSVNEAYDTWDEWEPTNPIEQMLKDAVNKNIYSG